MNQSIFETGACRAMILWRGERFAQSTGFRYQLDRRSWKTNDDWFSYPSFLRKMGFLNLKPNTFERILS